MNILVESHRRIYIGASHRSLKYRILKVKDLLFLIFRRSLDIITRNQCHIWHPIINMYFL